jgi:hypothetical protein
MLAPRPNRRVQFFTENENKHINYALLKVTHNLLIGDRTLTSGHYPFGEDEQYPARRAFDKHFSSPLYLSITGVLITGYPSLSFAV